MKKNRRRSLRSQRGFFIVFGRRTRISSDGSAPVQTMCPGCQTHANLVGKVARPWFTLYFLPVFPCGSGERFVQCSNCGGQYRGTTDDWRARAGAAVGARAGGAAAAAGTVDSGGYRAAIELYNSLRETPDDGHKLAVLMAMYRDLGDNGEAIYAAQGFPGALAASDDAMVLLAKCLQENGDTKQALHWLNEALRKNPGNAEAARGREALSGADRGNARLNPMALPGS